MCVDWDLRGVQRGDIVAKDEADGRTFYYMQRRAQADGWPHGSANFDVSRSLRKCFVCLDDAGGFWRVVSRQMQMFRGPSVRGRRRR